MDGCKKPWGLNSPSSIPLDISQQIPTVTTRTIYSQFQGIEKLWCSLTSRCGGVPSTAVLGSLGTEKQGTHSDFLSERFKTDLVGECQRFWGTSAGRRQFFSIKPGRFCVSYRSSHRSGHLFFPIAPGQSHTLQTPKSYCWLCIIILLNLHIPFVDDWTPMFRHTHNGYTVLVEYFPFLSHWILLVFIDDFPIVSPRISPWNPNHHPIKSPEIPWNQNLWNHMKSREFPWSLFKSHETTIFIGGQAALTSLSSPQCLRRSVDKEARQLRLALAEAI